MGEGKSSGMSSSGREVNVRREGEGEWARGTVLGQMGWVTFDVDDGGSRNVGMGGSYDGDGEAWR